MKNLNIRKTILMALFISMAIILQIIENALPYPLVPWAKLGLPNIIILFTLIYFDIWTGLIVNFTRSLLAGLISGMLFNPVFIIGISGGITSTFAMWIGLPLLSKKFTLVTISIIGALIHIITQFTVVYLFFFKELHLTQTAITFTAPWFLFFALPSGLITGMVANFVIGCLKNINFLERI